MCIRDRYQRRVHGESPQKNFMGIDLYRAGRIRNRRFRQTKTTDVYLRLLIRLYEFLSRRTNSRFNQAVYKRLNQTRTTRYPVSLSRLSKHMRNNNDKIAVVVGSILNDERNLEIPKLSVCALRFSERARERILAAGGQCLTFDQLALRAPTGTNTFLIRGARSREALKHFGKAPGAKHSHTKPYVRSVGRKFERGRGRR
eukprot:TRINITY_DN232_c0_g1_i11.p1 TRINITY_DN232_c0_g1~~TRINITY_DN232_c0_g1_i11.p1  ORF type:complete len:200 (+),score=59.71 TRINITY_DN232_c0_g1_i11:67-666(+)